jgi:hypothetical protein
VHLPILLPYPIPLNVPLAGRDLKYRSEQSPSESPHQALSTLLAVCWARSNRWCEVNSVPLISV